MTDYCIYCHRKIEYEAESERVKCAQCGEWMEVIRLGVNRRKLETAQQEAKQYKEAYAESQNRVREAETEKQKAEELLKNTLGELSNISALQADIKQDAAKQAEAQKRLEALSQSIHAAAASNSEALKATGCMLETLIKTQRTTDGKLSSLGNVANLLMRRAETTEDKLSELNKLTSALMSDAQSKNRQMSECMGKLQDDIAANGSLLQDIYGLFYQTKDSDKEIIRKLQEQGKGAEESRKKLNDAIEKLSDEASEIKNKAEAAEKSINEFRNEYNEDKSNKLLRIYEDAQGLMADKEYERAEKKYEELIEAGAKNISDLYFRKVLCRYGVEYVKSNCVEAGVDAVPTMYNIDLMENHRPEELNDVKQLLANAGDKRGYYSRKIQELTKIVDGYREVKLDNEYDVFISVKQKDEKGNTTPDSDRASDLYYRLQNEYGLRVFNSRHTRIPVGREYEPYILAALKSAKLLIVVSGSDEYIRAPWVENEWGRYLWLINHEKEKYGKTDRTLAFYLFGEMSPAKLPKKVRHMQAIEEKIGSDQRMLDLLISVFHRLNKQGSEGSTNTVSTKNEETKIQRLLERAQIELSVGDYDSCAKISDKVLEEDPKNTQAMLLMLMAERQVRDEKKLSESTTPLENSKYYKYLMEYGNAKLKKSLQNYNDTIKNRIEKEIRCKKKKMHRIILSSGTLLLILAIILFFVVYGLPLNQSNKGSTATNLSSFIAETSTTTNKDNKDETAEHIRACEKNSVNR